jgi:hypothetical protein
MIAKAIRYFTAGGRFSMPGIDSKTRLSPMATGARPMRPTRAARPGMEQCRADLARPPRHVAEPSGSGTGFGRGRPAAPRLRVQRSSEA